MTSTRDPSRRPSEETSARTLTAGRYTTLSGLERLDFLASEFDRRRAIEPGLTVEDFLREALADASGPSLRPHDRAWLLRELVAIDFEQRGDALPGPAADDYAARFPDLRREDVWRLLTAGRTIAAPDLDQQATLMSSGASMPSLAALRPLRRGDGEIAPGALRCRRPVLAYQVVGEIGRGGMGRILEARDADFGRPIALKVLREGLCGHPGHEGRFRREATITGRLQHPGIPPVHEVGRLDDGRPFFSMKLVVGQTLEDIFRGPRRWWPTSKLLQTFGQVAQTLAYAHSRGVLHRDLKPHNIMVGAFGEVQVMDWGMACLLWQLRESAAAGGAAAEGSGPAVSSIVPAADGTGNLPGHSTIREPAGGVANRLTEMGDVMGTPAYMPPEQANGELDRMGLTADVFGLGAILCQLLTGHPPYRGHSTARILEAAKRADLEDAFVRLDGVDLTQFDATLVDLCRRCLAVDPGDRPPDAAAVADRTGRSLLRVRQERQQARIDRAAARVRSETDAPTASEPDRTRFPTWGCVAAATATGWVLYRRAMASVGATGGGIEDRPLHAKLQAAAADCVQSRWRVAAARIDEAAASADEDGDRGEIALSRLRMQLAQAFEELHLHGLTPFGGADPTRSYARLVETAADHLHGLGDRWVAALDDWSLRSDRPSLLELADAVNDHPLRRRLRRWWREGRHNSVARLAASDAVLSLPSCGAAHLGCLLLRMGAADQAAMLAERLVRRRPDDYRAHLLLGAGLWRRGDRTGARARFRIALAAQPDSAVLRRLASD